MFEAEGNTVGVPVFIQGRIVVYMKAVAPAPLLPFWAPAPYFWYALAAALFWECVEQQGTYFGRISCCFSGKKEVQPATYLWQVLSAAVAFLFEKKKLMYGCVVRCEQLLQQPALLLYSADAIG